MQKVREFINRHFKTAMTVWGLGVTVLILWGFHDVRAQISYNHRQANLIRRNQSLISKQQAAIQKSRLHSCQENYRSVRRIFKPFFIPRNIQTPQQRLDELKFNKTIDNLIKGCVRQTKPHIKPNP